MYLSMSWAQGGWVLSSGSTIRPKRGIASLGVGTTRSSASSGLGVYGVKEGGSPAPSVDVDFVLGLSRDIEGHRSTSMYIPGGTRS